VIIISKYILSKIIMESLNSVGKYLENVIKSPFQYTYDGFKGLINDKSWEKIIDAKEQSMWGYAILNFLMKKIESDKLPKNVIETSINLPGINHSSYCFLPIKNFKYCERGFMGVATFSIEIIDGLNPLEYKYKTYEKGSMRLYELMADYINSLYSTFNGNILFPKLVYNKKWEYFPEKLPFYKTTQINPIMQEEVCEYLIENVGKGGGIMIYGLLNSKNFIPMIIFRKIHRIVYYVDSTLPEAELIESIIKIPNRSKIIVIDNIDSQYAGKYVEMHKIISRIFEVIGNDNIIMFVTHFPEKYSSDLFGKLKIYKTFDFS